jgi:hypothetical protein
LNEAFVDLFPGVEVVVHRRTAEARSHGDGLKRRGLITAFVDDLARSAKDARPCLGRVGTDRAAWSPAG